MTKQEIIDYNEWLVNVWCKQMNIPFMGETPRAYLDFLNKKSNMEIILLKFKKGTSFSWTNGLYAVVKTVENELHLAKLNDDGMIDRYDDGSPNILITGINNPSVIRTSLICNEQIDYK